MSPFPRPDFDDLVPYAPDPRPVEVDLSDNTSHWGPHPRAVEALADTAAEGLARYPTASCDRLREAVARRYGVPTECVTTGAGSDNLLDVAFRAGAAPGERLVHAAPTFSMVDVFARLNGLEPVPVPWSRLDGGPGPVVDAGPDLVYLCSPNNPTGHHLSAGWIRELLDALGPTGPLVLLDQAYVDFGGDDLLEEAPTTDRLLVLRTLSKAYGLAGLRVGWAVGPEAVVHEVEKSRGPYMVSRPGEAAAAAAVADPEGWIRERAARIRESRERLFRALTERDLRPLPSRGNFLLLPVSPPHTARGLAEELRRRGVAVRALPGLMEVGDALRISVGPWRLMERFLDALDGVLEGEDPGGRAAPERPGGASDQAAPDPDETRENAP